MKTTEKVKETLLVIATGLLVFYFIFKIEELIIAAAVIGIIGIISNFLSRQIAWLWFKLAEGLGFITSKILLTLIFYFLLFPIALLSRIFKKNPLQLKKPKTDSYYFTRNHEYQPKDIENAW